MEKRNLRIQQKMEDAWNDGYLTLSNLRELNVRTLRNELEWPMLLARQFVRIVTAMSFVEQRGVAVQENSEGKFFSLELLELAGEAPREVIDTDISLKPPKWNGEGGSEPSDADRGRWRPSKHCEECEAGRVGGW